MPNLINITQARNNLSKLITDVVTKRERVIIIRESTPEAVVIPYDEYQREEAEWRSDFRQLMNASKKRFKNFLKAKGLKYPKTEAEMYAVIDQVTGRN